MVAAAAALAVGSLAVARAARPGQREQKQQPQQQQQNSSSEPPGGAAAGANAAREGWVNESVAGVASSLLGLDGLAAASGSHVPHHGGHLVRHQAYSRRDRELQARQDAHLLRMRNNFATFKPNKLAGNKLGHAMPWDYGHIPHSFAGFVGIGSKSHKVRNLIHTGNIDQELVDAVIKAVLEERRAFNEVHEREGIQKLMEARGETAFQLLKVEDTEHPLRKAVEDIQQVEEKCKRVSVCNASVLRETLNELEKFVSSEKLLHELVQGGMETMELMQEWSPCIREAIGKTMSKFPGVEAVCVMRKEFEASMGEGCRTSVRKATSEFVCLETCAMNFEAKAHAALRKYGEDGKEIMRAEFHTLLMEPWMQDIGKDVGENALIAVLLDDARKILETGSEHLDPNYPDYVEVLLEEGRKALGAQDRLVQVVGIRLKPFKEKHDQEACADFCKGNLKLSPANFAHKDLVITAEKSSNLFSHYWNMSLMTCKQFHEILVAHSDRLCQEPLRHMAPKHNAEVLLKMWPQIEDNCCEDEPRAYYHVLEAYKRSLEEIERQLDGHILDMKSRDVQHLIDRLNSLLKDIMANLHVKHDDLLLTHEEKDILVALIRETADRMQKMHMKLLDAMKKEEFLTNTAQVLQLLKDLLKDVERAMARFKMEVLKVSDEKSWEMYKKKANAQHSGKEVANVNSNGGDKHAGRYGKAGKMYEIKDALGKWYLKTLQELVDQTQSVCPREHSRNSVAEEGCEGPEGLWSHKFELQMAITAYVGNYPLYASAYYDYVTLERYIERLYDRLTSGNDESEEVIARSGDHPSSDTNFKDLSVVSPKKGGNGGNGNATLRSAERSQTGKGGNGGNGNATLRSAERSQTGTPSGSGSRTPSGSGSRKRDQNVTLRSDVGGEEEQEEVFSNDGGGEEETETMSMGGSINGKRSSSGQHHKTPKVHGGAQYNRINGSMHRTSDFTTSSKHRS